MYMQNHIDVSVNLCDYIFLFGFYQFITPFNKDLLLFETLLRVT
jgi:hypothetical protein